MVRARHERTGGLAAVKRAHDVGRLQRDFLRKEIAMLSRLARLGHAGVVRVLETGSDGGRLWYAMEFIDGPDLKTVSESFWRAPLGEAPSQTITAVTVDRQDLASALAVANGGQPANDVNPTPLPWPEQELQPVAAGHLQEVLDIGLRLADAIAFVHSEGVVHGDLKPRNIMFRGDTGAAVLVDFGAAVHASAGATSREIAQVERMRHGTPGYMAPEQIAREPLDARCDLYALGAILFELLVGRLPFLGDDVESLQRQTLHVAPPTPSSLVDGVPAALEELVMGLLAKDPRDRVGYAQDVVSTINRLLARDAAGLPELPGRRLYRARMTGREAELDQLIGHLQSARQGQGGLVCVAGESGVGKTRLVNELGGRAVSDGFEVVVGQCSDLSQAGSSAVSLHGAALHPFLPFLLRLFDRLSLPGTRLSIAPLAAPLAALAPYAPSLAELPEVAQQRLPDLPHVLARARVFRSLAELLVRFAAHSPLLLVLDDLHWADDLTLAFLQSRHLTELSSARVLLVATYRTEQVDPTLHAAVERQPGRLISLQRLGIGSIRMMAKDMLASPLAPEGLAEFLHRHSEGNPFFAAEYLRATVEQGLLRRGSDQQWRAPWLVQPRPGDSAELPIPRSLQGVLELRMEGLSADASRLLELACVLGRNFRRDILMAMQDERAEALTADESLAVEELIARQILEETSPGHYRFVHDKLREARELAIPAPRRRALHALAAVRLEDLLAKGGLPSERHDAEIGSHWAQAGDPVRSFPYLERAARNADAIHANGQAIDLALLAVAQAEAAGMRARDGASTRLANLGELLADLLVRAARHGEARRYYDWTLQLAAPDPVRAARLLRKKAQSYWTVHEYSPAESALRAAAEQLGNEQLLDRPEQHQEWIEIQLGQFWRHYFARRTGPATEAIIAAMADRVESYATPVQRSTYFVCAALDILGRGRYGPDARAVAFTRRAVEVVAGDEQFAAPAALARFNLGFTLLFGNRAEQEEGVAELGRTVREAELLGDVTVAARAFTYLAVGWRRLGRTDEVAATADRALRAADEARLPPYVGATLACQAWVSWKQGDRSRAQAKAREALDWWRKSDHAFPFRWLATLVLLDEEARWDRFEGVEPLLRDLLDPQQQVFPEDLQSALRAAGDALSRGSPRDKGEALDRVLRLAVEHGYL